LNFAERAEKSTAIIARNLGFFLRMVEAACIGVDQQRFSRSGSRSLEKCRKQDPLQDCATRWTWPRLLVPEYIRRKLVLAFRTIQNVGRGFCHYLRITRVSQI
jgi:hypothetical protein